MASPPFCSEAVIFWDEASNLDRFDVGMVLARDAAEANRLSAELNARWNVALELTRLRGHLILGRDALEEGAHVGSSVEVSARVPA